MLGEVRSLSQNPSYRITDVANAIDEKCDQKIIGIRSWEKIQREMITSSDSFTTYDLGKFYVILPQQPVWDLEKYIEVHKGKKSPKISDTILNKMTISLR